MFAPKNILVPTDFSDYSDKALKQALEIATQYKSKVNLLHVIAPLAPCTVDYCPDDAVLHQAEENMISQASNQMHAEVDKFNEFKGLAYDYDVREGHPSDEILKDQEEKGVDLIVMASHGKTGFIKRMIGTVSEKVAEEARCSVLIVRN